MPQSKRDRPPDPQRSPEERAADHAAVERLTSELLPSLVARLAATGLGEVELREEGWRLRVRRPASGVNHGRRSSDRPGRQQPGHGGHGHPPAALEGHRPARGSALSSNGSSPGPDAGGHAEGDGELPGGTIATSPAVGIFQPRSDLRPGIAVRSGERLGVVDVLGISQEVVAPADGLVGAPLVEAGHAVEYGQELMRIERTSAAMPGSAPGAAPGPAPGSAPG